MIDDKLFLGEILLLICYEIFLWVIPESGWVILGQYPLWKTLNCCHCSSLFLIEISYTLGIDLTENQGSTNLTHATDYLLLGCLIPLNLKVCCLVGCILGLKVLLSRPCNFPFPMILGFVFTLAWLNCFIRKLWIAMMTVSKSPHISVVSSNPVI